MLHQLLGLPMACLAPGHGLAGAGPLEVAGVADLFCHRHVTLLHDLAVAARAAKLDPAGPRLEVDLVIESDSAPEALLGLQQTLLVAARGQTALVIHFGPGAGIVGTAQVADGGDRKSTRLNSSHQLISYAVFCLK